MYLHRKSVLFKTQEKEESFQNPKYTSSLGFLERVCLGTLGNSSLLERNALW